MKRDYSAVRDYFLRAAEEMPDTLYPFRPTRSVRTFAQQVAHVADDQYNLCAPARGEVRKAAYTAIEDSLSTSTTCWICSSTPLSRSCVGTWPRWFHACR